MQKKKYSTVVLIVVFSFLLCACQIGPPHSIVTSKNDGAFDANLQQRSPQQETHEITLKRSNSFTSTDNSVEFKWKLDQTLAIGAMPVLEAAPYLFTSEDVQRIVKSIFGDDIVFYDVGPESQRQLSKSEIQEKISLLSKYANAENLNWLMGQEANLEALKRRILLYTQQYETAPDMNPHTVCDWTLKPSNYYQRNEDGKTDTLIATTRIDNFDYQIEAHVRNQRDYIKSDIQIGLGDGNGRETSVERAINTAQLCITEKPTQAQIEQAKATAQNMLDKMGLGDYVIAETLIDVRYYGDTPAYQIWIEAEPVLEGANVLYGDFGRSYIAKEQYNSEYPVGQIQFFFSANSDLISFRMHSLVKVLDVKNSDVVTLSMDELMEKAQNYMSLYDAEALDKFTGNTLILEALTGRAPNTLDCKVEITEAAYGLSRYPIADSNSFYYAPTVIFRGTIDYCDPETGEVVTGTGNPNGSRVQTLAVVNAVDGTIF